MAVFVTRLIQPIVMGTNAGDLNVGTEVILNENGQPVNYLIVNQGIPENSALYDASCEGTWLLRKDIRANGKFDESGSGVLSGSTIMTTMAGYVDDYDPKVQEAIKTVKIPYCVGGGTYEVNSGVNGLECKIFPLSGVEFGWNVSQGEAFSLLDGASLLYFSGLQETDEKRIAKLNGVNSFQWTRHVYGTTVTIVRNNGGYSFFSSDSDNCGFRPALILPYEFRFTSDQIVA